MPSESFLVTALPYSADPAGEFHVSLFVTHRLGPDGSEGRLRQFRHVSQWGTVLTGAGFRLTGSDGGDIPVTPLIDKVVPDLWPRVFPGNLVVRPWQTPELAAVPWRSFPAHRMDRYGRDFHALAAFLSPVGTPSLTERLLPALALWGLSSRAISAEDLSGEWADHEQQDGEFRGSLLEASSRREQKAAFEAFLRRMLSGAARGDPRGTSTLRALELMDDRVTAWLDDLTAGGTLAPAPAAGGPFKQVLVDLHMARRYYERPEEQRPYQAEPSTPPRPHQRPPRPDPDFHQRCTLLGGTPGVLRELGLVVDLHVDDLSRLDGLEWIRGDILVEGLENAVVGQPAVRCQVAGTAFTTVSSSGDYAGGALRLGDEERYDVLDLDPDATGLKLERFLRSLPRLAYSALNGDPAHAAPATLRASGFSIARRDRAASLRERLTDTTSRDDDLFAGEAAPLDTESVTRGLRLEVWDDVSGTWHSLHRRLVDVEVDRTVVLRDEEDVGFLQGAALSRADESVSSDPLRPYHAHEVFAGWEGWSLSAPPPGKVVVDETEEPVDHPDDPAVTPVVVRSKAAPGSLPRLRYGRSYAFRAWAVDLAGNSPPPGTGATTGPLDPGDLGAVVEWLGPLRDTAGTDADELAEAGRQGVLAARAHLASMRPSIDAIRIDDLAPSRLETVNRVVRARVAARAQEQPLQLRASRGERIDQVVGEVLESERLLIVPTSTTVQQGALAHAVAAATASRLGIDALKIPDVVKGDSDLVTTPRPFLRWDAVPPPAWVPRHPYTDGESLQTLVVRSGVEVGADGAVVVTPPAALAAAMAAAHPELQWRPDSQRHLAPPKSSQLQAEHHGMFDAAFGPAATPKMRSSALAVALREAGTFLDRTIAHPTKPGQRVPQPNVQLHNTPTADPKSLVTLADIEKTRGRPLGPGQYVVHDVDALVLPYLPDPLSHGVSLVFPDAGRDHRLEGLLAVEGVTLPFAGGWPEVRPHRLVVENGAALGARVDGHVVTVNLPPGERLRMRVSSCLTAAGLELLGPWRGMAEGFRENEDLVEAARDGWFWWLTPYEEVQLVHAVPRPVERPRVPFWATRREEGDTAVHLGGVIDVHGPSTERLDIEARWSEPVDDPAKDGPEEILRTGVAGHAAVPYEADLILFDSEVVEPVTLPGGMAGHPVLVHGLEDTRHRRIDYTVRATTRYREFFPPALYPGIDDLSVLSDPMHSSVPSSARPPKPVVRDVLPLFRWSESTEPAQPFGLRRTRRTGLRVYLERPWFATGEGELLGVVVGTDERAQGSVSAWAADPVWRQEGPSSATVLPLLDALSDEIGFVPRPEAGRPVAPRATLPLVDVPGAPEAEVLGYRPEFSTDRKLWFVDIALDPGTAFWPFVRLAVVRYQPESLPGLHLSPVVVCDFAQLTPERTATVTRPDVDHARVVVTGVIDTPRERALSEIRVVAEEDGRAVVARLERRDPSVDSDLGWVTVAVKTLPVGGREGQVVSWSGVFTLPEAVPLRRPGADVEWRIAIEEWELLPADGPTGGSVGVAGRVVYADHLAL